MDTFSSACNVVGVLYNHYAIVLTLNLCVCVYGYMSLFFLTVFIIEQKSSKSVLSLFSFVECVFGVLFEQF